MNGRTFSPNPRNPPPSQRNYLKEEEEEEEEERVGWSVVWCGGEKEG